MASPSIGSKRKLEELLQDVNREQVADHQDVSDMDTQQTASFPTSSIPNCDQCKTELAKYKCPRCGFKSCSLACCVEHKKSLDCDGQRDRTKYISVGEFRDKDLHSDYFFLEEVSRSADSARRVLSQSGGKPGRSYSRVRQSPGQQKQETTRPQQNLQQMPNYLRILVKEAKARGVDLFLMPVGMSKRKQNTSYFQHKGKVLQWRVELEFIDGDVAFKTIDEKVDDNTVLTDLLDKYLKPSGDIGTAMLRHKLKTFTTEGSSSLALLLRKEFAGGSNPIYYKLNNTETIRANLARKTIVEFPTILVVLASHLDEYAIARDLIEEVGPSEVPHLLPHNAVEDAAVVDDLPNNGEEQQEGEEEEKEEEEEGLTEPEADFSSIAEAVEAAMLADGLATRSY